MPIVRASVSIEVDGVPVPGSPFVRQKQCDEGGTLPDFEKPGTGDVTFSAVPADVLDVIQVLFLSVTEAVTIRLDGQSDAGIVLNPNGLILAFDVTIDAGAGASNASVNNAEAAEVIAKLRGVAAGS